MRFAAASDLHGDLSMVQRFAGTASNLDVSGIIIAGDIGPTVEKIITNLSKLKLPIYAVLGNDDLLIEEQILDQIPYALNIHGQSVDIGPCEIIGLSGCLASATSPHDEEKIYDTLKKAFSHASKPVILVSHLPPYGILDLATYHGTSHVGSKSVRRIIEKYHPAICICGHVHKDGGKRDLLGETEVANISALADDEVSKSQGRRFAILDIDENKKCTLSFDYLIDVIMPIEKFIMRYV
jgi:Icc-related predicted phosphoesterase